MQYVVSHRGENEWNCVSLTRETEDQVGTRGKWGREYLKLTIISKITETCIGVSVTLRRITNLEVIFLKDLVIIYFIYIAPFSCLLAAER
jgi:hypothetical protein